MSDLRRELLALQKHSSLLNYGAMQLGRSPHLRESAARDAITLLLYTLGITRAQFYADPDRAITPEQQAAYEAAVARRLTNEPIQHITGEQEFYGLALRITPAVLIPRPETEHLVEAVLMELADPGNKSDAVILSEGAVPRQRERAAVEGPQYSSSPLDTPNRSKDAAAIPSEAESAGAPRSRGTTASAFDPQRPHILDVGTGSGAIAIALARHLPHARITATDISPTALSLARENAARHNVRIEFIESDLLEKLESVIPSEDAHLRDVVEGPAVDSSHNAGPFDAIVSNPPYVPLCDRPALHPQVRDYEPPAALFAGDDGLDIYRRLVPQARAALVPNGLLALEIGHGQREALAALLSDWSSVRFVDDLQGIPRVALARKPE